MESLAEGQRQCIRCGAPLARQRIKYCSLKCYRGTDKERFFEKVNKPQSKDGCWMWGRATDKCGYGTFRLVMGDGKIETLAHRASWILNVGPIPIGKHILHTCDHPSCVNPKHLFAGTPKENTQDMIDKGRDRFRESAKLKDYQVIKIREMADSGLSSRKIAKHFPVGYHAVLAILSKKVWRHV